MNKQQTSYYTQVLSYLSNITTTQNPYFFVLDNNFYQSALGAQISKGDKIAIGKHFKEEVNNKKIPNIVFDYKYSNCPRCGYKDSSNKVHYKKI